LATLILVGLTFCGVQILDNNLHQVSAQMRDPTQDDIALAPANQPFSQEHGVTASVAMPLCSGWPRINCVIDGDTIWYQGTKIRIADINAPETHDPKCTYEATLGKRATNRMIELLNAGPFDVVTTGDRDEDVYGRKLRVIARNGHSLGQMLVDQGLAERWQGYRRNWCA
jgi:endonuclease YncB( thermonuclease family)